MRAEVGKRYKHYKGKEYTVIALGRDEETLENVVVYRAEYDTKDFGTNPIWVRKRTVFEDKLEINDDIVERFSLIS